MTDRFFGLQRGVVVDTDDPTGQGRIAVAIPQLFGDGHVWAATSKPGPGIQWNLDLGTEVFVAFESGEAAYPVVLGVSKKDPSLPAGRLISDAGTSVSFDAGQLRVHTVSGATIVLDDTVTVDVNGNKLTIGGNDAVHLTTVGGHSIKLDDSGATISDRHGNVIELSGTTVQLSALGTLRIAAAKLDVQTPLVAVTGMVHASVLIADSRVVSPSYTPGAGNLI